MQVDLWILFSPACRGHKQCIYVKKFFYFVNKKKKNIYEYLHKFEKYTSKF
jgi:hypothetical protein